MKKNIGHLVLCIYLLSITSCAFKTGEEYYKQAKYLDEIGEPKRAFRTVKKAIRKNKKNHLYYILKAETRYHGWATKKGSLKNVLNDYNTALKYKIYSLDVFKSRWKYFEFLGTNKEIMLDDLQKVLNIDSTDVDAWIKIGKLNFEYNDTIKGYYCFNKALLFCNNKDSVNTLLADTELDAKLFKKAKNRYLSLLNKSDKVLYYRYFALSLSYWNINNRDSACFYFKYVNEKYLYGKLFEIKAYCDALR